MIKNAGGIIIGKTNVPTRALDYQTYNPIFGKTNNPYDVERTCGGSSGGSAAAVALNYAPFAVGSDFGGSLRIPASFTGITSFKPSFNKISIDGHLVNSHKGSHNYLVTVGPMAKSVTLTYILYRIMKGTSSLSTIESKPIDELKLLISPNIKNYEIDARIFKKIVTFGESLQSLGAKVEIKSVELESKLISDTYKAFFNINSEKIRGDEISVWEKRQKKIHDQQLDIFTDFDCWILPVTSTLAIKHNPSHQNIIINGKSINYWKALGQYCIPFSVSGLPVLTLPIGMIQGLPCGIQIISREKEVNRLFSLSKTLEIAQN